MDVDENVKEFWRPYLKVYNRTVRTGARNWKLRRASLHDSYWCLV